MEGEPLAEASASLCQVIGLDPSFEGVLVQGASYCSSCHRLLLNLSSMLRDLRRLEVVVGEERVKVERLLKENYATCCRNEAASNADFELLTSLNLSRTTNPLLDEYDALVKRIVEAWLQTTPSPLPQPLTPRARSRPRLRRKTLLSQSQPSASPPMSTRRGLRNRTRLTLAEPESDPEKSNLEKGELTSGLEK